jgi:hypothetical protein
VSMMSSPGTVALRASLRNESSASGVAVCDLRVMPIHHG